MRKIQDLQRRIMFSPKRNNPFKNWEKIAEILDVLPETNELVAADLRAQLRSNAGAKGMTAEQVLRCAIIKQVEGLSYRDLADRLDDSLSLRRFSLFYDEETPGRSALQHNISRLTAETLAAVNRALVGHGRTAGVESGRKLRIDTTAIEANIHHPTDASLLYDCIRVCSRTLHQLRAALPELKFVFHDRTRVAKRRLFQLVNLRSQGIERKRKRLYRRLLGVARQAISYLRSALEALRGRFRKAAGAGLIHSVKLELRRLRPLFERVIDQAERRIIKGQKVPAADKVVSIFEDHADIIVKGGRDIVFGHKVCFSAGASGLVVDVIMERGNPADVAMFRPALDNSSQALGRVPAQVATDSGFASQANAEYARRKGVKDVCMTRRLGHLVENLVKSAWVRKQLLRFRAGMEGVISTLKRALGLDRCNWEGWGRFKSYVWLGVIGHNLRTLSYHLAKG